MGGGKVSDILADYKPDKVEWILHLCLSFQAQNGKQAIVASLQEIPQDQRKNGSWNKVEKHPTHPRLNTKCIIKNEPKRAVK